MPDEANIQQPDREPPASAPKPRKARIVAAGTILLDAIGAISDIGGVRDMGRELFLGETVTIPAEATVTMTLDEYEERQKFLRQQILAELEDAAGQNQLRLTSELKEVERRLADTQSAYDQSVVDLKDLQRKLDSAEGFVATERLQEARELLAKGETRQADTIFAEVEAATQNAVMAAADAAYARGESQNRKSAGTTPMTITSALPIYMTI